MLIFSFHLKSAFRNPKDHHWTDNFNLTRIQSPYFSVQFSVWGDHGGSVCKMSKGIDSIILSMSHSRSGETWSASFFVYSSFNQELLGLANRDLKPVITFKGNNLPFSSGIWTSSFSTALCKLCYLHVQGPKGLTGDITVTLCLLILSPLPYHS